jgi:hypothetical protein
MIVAMHPDVAKLKFKFKRWHHAVDYSGFTQKLILRRGVKVPNGPALCDGS